MSLSTLREASLSRYLIPVGLLAATLLTYHYYSTTRTPAAKRLKRSNARRVSRRTGRRTNSHPNSAASSSTADPDPGGILTDEQLVEALSAESGLEISGSVAEALVDAAVAAQEARGAGGDRPLRNGGDDDSDFSYAPDTKENQNLLNLLYLIAEDQSKRDSYVHRGVTCNSCNIMPIRGIRYRCANCVDFDLCEHCEALDSHPKTHLFYKVRIPAPFLGNPRQAQPPWYPGKPGLMPLALPQEVIRKFTGEQGCGVEQPELEALYEQFKCLAATEYLSDPLSLNGAISRQTFDKCFIPNTHLRPPPPNLIYDRMFSFYDTDSNGLIGFEEFVRGLSALNNKHRYVEKLRRIFKGYDLDGDGFVDRRDFLRMFRAFYALTKDLVKDVVACMDDDMLEANQAVNVLVGSQPISAAFAGSIPGGSRREGKSGWEVDSDGEVEEVVLPSGDDRAMERSVSGDQTFEDWMAAAGEDFNSASSAAVAATMPAMVQDERVVEGRRRWRWEDEGEEEQDVGGEILFQITLQGLNELLDLLFAAKEEMAVEARREREVVKKDEPDAEGEGSGEGSGEGGKGDEGKEGEEGEKDSGEPTEKAPTAEEKEKKEQERLKEEIKERGGEGRLNFDEFERIMRGKHGHKLGFVAAWIDMAGF